ncbi:MAG: hypothetical protein HC927_10495 [Deltaproteobacteria bacterium]|nr:hypothetical protein [Deltaproteobacteria bacterium]
MRVPFGAALPVAILVALGGCNNDATKDDTNLDALPVDGTIDEPDTDADADADTEGPKPASNSKLSKRKDRPWSQALAPSRT